MKKIVFGITSLGLGGAERVLVDIVNEICDKYEITIFSLYGNGEFEKQLDKKVKFVSVYKESFTEIGFMKRKWISLQMICSSLRKKIYNKYIKDKFDVEVAFLEGPITWIMSEKSKAKKIVWVHNDIEDVFGKDKGSSLKQKMNKECYEKYNNIVFVSKDNMKKFKKYFPDVKAEMQVIYNYLNTDSVKEKANAFKVTEIDKKCVSFVQVSRLVDQKAVLRLLDVHKKLIGDGLLHNIYIVGDGPLRGNLESKIKEYGVKDSFILLGKKENPYPYIKAADYFMLMSYYEGYPMVLLEGKALEKYILITDSAARETLIGYNDSKIVKNNEKGIYEGIKDIVENKPKALKNNKDMNKEILNEVISLIDGEV